MIKIILQKLQGTYYSVPSEYDHSRELPESLRNSIVPLNKII